MAGRSFGGSFEGAILVSSVIIACFVLAAIILTPIALIGIPAYIGFRLWRDSPARAEKIAREDTDILYQHALTGSFQISDAEIKRALTAHWPPDMPDILRVQLLDLARGIYEAEGLSPDIPPPPALCNTLEGGRYRDQLARLGQVRHDRGMAMKALEIISRNFATSIRGVTNRAVPLSFPFFVLEKRPRVDAETLQDIRDHSRNAYAAPWVHKARDEPLGEAPTDESKPENPEDDPLKPSTEL